MDDLAYLSAEVSEQTSVEASVITLLEGIANGFEAANGDRNAINSVIEAVRGNKEKLSDDVSKNTPTVLLPRMVAADVSEEDLAPEHPVYKREVRLDSSRKSQQQF